MSYEGTLLVLITVLGLLHYGSGSELHRKSRELLELSIGNKDYNITRMVAVAKSYEQCYVSVVVYNSTTLTEPSPGATVTAISLSGTNYTGFSQATTDTNGQACLLVQCYAQGIIYVEKGGERLFAATEQKQRNNLPPSFRVDIKNNGQEVHFHNFVFGTVFGRTGPVYNSRDYDDCQTDARNNHYFTFSYLSVPDQLISTPVPTNMPNIDQNFMTNASSKLVWLYGFPGDTKTCYMKMKIKVGDAPVIINIQSRLKDQNGANLGVFITGPKPDPVNPTDDKLACLMFRCPVEDIFGADDYPTYIHGNITGVNACTIKNQANKDISVSVTNMEFSGVIPVKGQLSPKDGLFQNEDANKARARCFTGNDFLGESDKFEVSNNIAFELDCTPANVKVG